MHFYDTIGYILKEIFMEEKRDFPTQFRLTHGEREFLKLHGKGSLSDGFKSVLQKAGFNTKAKHQKQSKVIVRRDFNFDREEYRYLRIENDRAVYAISVSDSRQREMIQKFGNEIFFEDAILKGLFPLPEDLRVLNLVNEIIDVVSNKILWKRK